MREYGCTALYIFINLPIFFHLYHKNTMFQCWYFAASNRYFVIHIFMFIIINDLASVTGAPPPPPPERYKIEES
jgi:hypothetical protein